MIEPESLSAAAFAPFGEVLGFEAEGARLVNEGYALRSDMAADLFGSTSAAPTLAIYRAKPRVLPLELNLLERHPHSTQAFLALTAARFLVVVAPSGDDGLPDLRAARAFLGRGGQGINYRSGVWHAPITALDQGGDFAMLMWERKTAEDCIVHHSPTALRIDEITH